MKVVIEDASNISVSNSATLDQLVNLYYDHLMPKSSRKELLTQMADENESMRNAEVVNSLSSSKGEINCMIKKRKHSVDNNTDELSVSSAKQPNCSDETINNSDHNLIIPVDNLISKETNVNIPVDNNNVHQSVCKKDTVQLDSLMKEIMRSVPQPTDKKSSSNADSVNTDSQSNSTIKKRQKINRDFKTLVQ
uniref:Ashwin n=1 Tax=Trichobilharzia regenti TaxID=157069 RepID=A0AA85J997_TRIRE|nr:unnamed protein product [Trichobilharzia regenti]